MASAIELTQYLMKKYNVPADHVIRHYDVTGKICPNPYVYNTTKHVWDAFKKAIATDGAGTEDTSKMTKITGKAVATAEQMAAYIKAKNATEAFVPYLITTTTDVLNMELSGDKVIMAGNITVEVKNVKGE